MMAIFSGEDLIDRNGASRLPQGGKQVAHATKWLALEAGTPGPEVSL